VSSKGARRPGLWKRVKGLVKGLQLTSGPAIEQEPHDGSAPLESEDRMDAEELQSAIGSRSHWTKAELLALLQSRSPSASHTRSGGLVTPDISEQYDDEHMDRDDEDGDVYDDGEVYQRMVDGHVIYVNRYGEELQYSPSGRYVYERDYGNHDHDQDNEAGSLADVNERDHGHGDVENRIADNVSSKGARRPGLWKRVKGLVKGLQLTSGPAIEQEPHDGFAPLESDDISGLCGMVSGCTEDIGINSGVNSFSKVFSVSELLIGGYKRDLKSIAFRKQMSRALYPGGFTVDGDMDVYQCTLEGSIVYVDKFGNIIDETESNNTEIDISANRKKFSSDLPVMHNSPRKVNIDYRMLSSDTSNTITAQTAPISDGYHLKTIGFKQRLPVISPRNMPNKVEITYSAESKYIQNSMEADLDHDEISHGVILSNISTEESKLMNDVSELALSKIETHEEPPMIDFSSNTDAELLHSSVLTEGSNDRGNSDNCSLDISIDITSQISDGSDDSEEPVSIESDDLLLNQPQNSDYKCSVLHFNSPMRTLCLEDDCYKIDALQVRILQLDDEVLSSSSEMKKPISSIFNVSGNISLDDRTYSRKSRYMAHKIDSNELPHSYIDSINEISISDIPMISSTQLFIDTNSLLVHVNEQIDLIDAKMDHFLLRMENL
jgi:hypothetical protein